MSERSTVVAPSVLPRERSGIGGSWAGRRAGVHVVTDLEGRRGAIDDLVDADCLKWDGDEFDFVHDGDRLLFAGDIGDRGPFTIRLVEGLLSLRRRYPSRVAWTFGNLDLKNLCLLRDLPLLGPGTLGYDEWLQMRASAAVATERGQSTFNPTVADTLDRRVEYWLHRQGSSSALEFHRLELSELRRRPCHPLEAAQDFLTRIQPGGSMFEYLRLGQVAIVHGNVLVNHGGVSRANIGFLPGATARYADAHEWIDALNRWAGEQIMLIERSISERGLGVHIPDALVRYADGIWDPTVGAGTGALFMNDVSLIYPFRQRECGNLRAPDKASIAYLQRAGIDTEVVGHTPIGDVPGPLKVNGFLRLMADTSRRRAGAHSTITIDQAGGLRVRGQTSRGVTVSYRISARGTSLVGSVTREGGYTVVGRARLPGGTKFLLSKYFDGYNIRDLVVDRNQLVAMCPLPAIASTPLDEPARHFELLVAELRRKGKRILELGQLEAYLGQRTPVVVSGFSKFGQSPIPDDLVCGEAAALVAQLGNPAECLIVTGGTDNGFERAVHVSARAAGHRVLGFIQQATIAGEVNLVDDVAFAGAHQDWSAPLLASLTFAADHGGFAVFVGGGGVVTEGIGYARELGMAYVLLDRAPEVTGSGGASGEAAAALDRSKRARHVVRSLKDLRAAIRSQEDLLLTGGSQRDGSAHRQHRRIGVFVGSFDPPHAGHRDLVLRARRQFGLDRIYVVPDPVTRYKRMQPLPHRQRMAELLFAEDAAVTVWNAANGLTAASGEMWDLLAAVQKRHPDAELFDIVGSDTLRWYAIQPQEHHLPGLRLLVNDRHDGPPLPSEIDGQPVQVIEGLDRGLSSTSIREGLMDGRPTPGLPSLVRDYVVTHGLYRAGHGGASTTAPATPNLQDCNARPRRQERTP